MHLMGYIPLILTSLIFENVLADVNSTENSLITGWDLFFHIKGTKTYSSCAGMFVNPHAFISDSWCVLENWANDTNQSVFISKIHNYTFQKLYYVNKTRMYFNENLNDHYNETQQSIVTLFTNEPFDVLEDPNNQTDFVKLGKDDDIDYSQCFVPNYGRYDVNFTYCDTSRKSMINSTENFILCEFIDNISIGSAVICNPEHDVSSKILVGILSGVDRLYLTEEMEEMEITSTFERVKDVGAAIDRKLESLNIR